MTAWGVVGAQAYQYGNPRSHQWFEQWELKGDYTMRYFIEPVALVAAYAKSLGCENTLARACAVSLFWKQEASANSLWRPLCLRRAGGDQVAGT